MNTTTTITDSQIETLKQIGAARGDDSLVWLCDTAKAGDEQARGWCAEAIALELRLARILIAAV